MEDNMNNNKKEKRNLVAYVHVGPRKTGTTQIQSFVVTTDKILLENDLAIWPDMSSSHNICLKNGNFQQERNLSSIRTKHMAFYERHAKECPRMRSEFEKCIRNFCEFTSKYFFYHQKYCFVIWSC